MNIQTAPGASPEQHRSPRPRLLDSFATSCEFPERGLTLAYGSREIIFFIFVSFYVLSSSSSVSGSYTVSEHEYQTGSFAYRALSQSALLHHQLGGFAVLFRGRKSNLNIR